MTDPPSGVSVVIPTRGRRSLLPAVLTPLLADPSTREVLVVVDGDVDGSLELLKRVRRRDRRVRPLETQGAAGAGTARQLGVEAAAADVILLLDDDVVAGPGLVTGHARHHAGESGRVVLGYMPVEPMPGGREAVAAQLYAEAYEERCAAYERKPNVLLHNLWAGNMSLRRYDCLAVGFADEYFAGGYHADRDFGLRCAKAGLVGVFDRSLRAQHRYRRSWPDFVDDARSQGVTLVLVHQRHRDLVGTLDPDRAFAHGLTCPAVALVAATQRPRAYRLMSASLLATVRWSPRSLQVPAARLLRRVEQQHGARAAARVKPAPPIAPWATLPPPPPG